MSHFVTFVLVPKIDGGCIQDYREAADQMLAPYDEELEVERYAVAFSDNDVERMRKYYQLPDASLEKLALKMMDWCGDEGFVENGTLYHWSTYNPESRWDWWEIGGRYSGRLNDEDNIVPVSELGQHWKAPFAVVSKNGEWHQRADMHWFGITTNEQSDERWKAECSEIFSGHQDCMIVVCDLHI
jgi:hypothetical protein